jgi:hypothetical protein
MKTHLVISLFAVGILAGSLQNGSTANAQGKAARKVLETKTAKYRGAGTDENINNASELNDPNTSIQPPPGRGGNKTRGGFATVRVENWTKWMVKIYGNGAYVGTVSSYGTMDFTSRSGPVGLYARAEMLDGSSLYWGPAATEGDAGSITTWKLR